MEGHKFQLPSGSQIVKTGVTYHNRGPAKYLDVSQPLPPPSIDGYFRYDCKEEEKIERTKIESIARNGTCKVISLVTPSIKRRNDLEEEEDT
ncbi:hypothetical protein CEXT_655841 [Caerostris extrusa]|uniref:Uncharacterized protein n=1 Tax=Caerostris extrusa TaxID=172846 RepID=A0AAV4NKL2_CAEEX|nr:hypothetical protein CEXT_655841 [Caerostris extrusa]